MKHPTENITIKYSRKYVYFYVGELLLHKIKQVIDDRYFVGEHIVKYLHINPYVKQNRLYVTKDEGYINRPGKRRLVSYPLKADVLHELSKLRRKVITEKLKRTE